jgi:MOSC domain-containing protein YiiM
MKNSETGSVESLLIKAKGDGEKSRAFESVDVEWAGFRGDKHSGETMPAGRSNKAYTKGTEIRNTRQISIVSTEELKLIADELGISNIKAEWVGANMLLSGIEKLTSLPTASRLTFENGVGLVVEEDNLPCTDAGKEIQENYPEVEGITTAFPRKAIGKRGLIAWVERPGKLSAGESVTVLIP